MGATFTLTVNGQKHSVTTDPQRPLLDVLREDLQLTGTKFGCGEGAAGRAVCWSAANGCSLAKRRSKMSPINKCSRSKGFAKAISCIPCKRRSWKRTRFSAPTALWHDHGRRRAVGRKATPQRGGNRVRHESQHLPLLQLSENRYRREAGRRGREGMTMKLGVRSQESGISQISPGLCPGAGQRSDRQLRRFNHGRLREPGRFGIPGAD